jgi:hypothetical protein
MTDERSVEDIAKDVFSECSNVGELFITEIVRALRIERTRVEAAEEEVERLKAEAGNYSEKEGYEIALKVAKEENRVLKDEIVRLKYELEAIRE